MLKSRYHSERKQTIEIREALLQYDASEGKQEEREKALQRIRDSYCHWNHNQTKPTNLKKIKKNAEEAKGGDTSEEEDPDLAHYKTSFKAEEEFSKNLLVESLIENNNATNIHPVSMIM